MQPCIGLIVFDRLSSELNDFYKTNEKAYQEFRTMIANEFAEIEADRIRDCCNAAVDMNVKDVKITFHYFDGCTTTDDAG